MSDVGQNNIAPIIHETIQLLNKAIGKLSQVICYSEKDPIARRKLKSRARKQITETVKKHFS